MPIYEYRCENGHIFEVMQKMTDDPVSVCSTCEAPVQRVFHPVAVHFKGKGFYNTDYGTKRRNRELERSGAQDERPTSASQGLRGRRSSSSSSSSSVATARVELGELGARGRRAPRESRRGSAATRAALTRQRTSLARVAAAGERAP